MRHFCSEVLYKSVHATCTEQCNAAWKVIQHQIVGKIVVCSRERHGDVPADCRTMVYAFPGVLHELRGHLQVSLEGQEMMRDQAASLAKLKAQVSMQQSSQLELKRQADEINELRKRLVSSNESIKHITLTQKALAEKANMLDEQVMILTCDLRRQGASYRLSVCYVTCYACCLE